MAAPRRVTVESTPTLVQAVVGFDPYTTVAVQTEAPIYLGYSNVTDETGWLLDSGVVELTRLDQDLYAVSGGGDVEVSVWALGAGT